MNTFGNNIKITIFGESHGKVIGLTIDNFPVGLKIDYKLIDERLSQRRGLSHLTSKRHESDNYEFISGVFNDYTTGAPITVLVDNNDLKSDDYQKNYGIARPSHADLTYYQKYNGFNDYRGGGTSSGRLTVVLIILGALCEQILKEKNIIVASRIKSIYNIEDSDFEVTDEILNDFKNNVFVVYNEEIKEQMLRKIREVKEENDSLGGLVETFIKNVPFGLGEPFFDSFESIISHLVFSIPGVKGIEFGKGFKITTMLGSEANDQIRTYDDKIVYLTNNNGGINGGITNSDIINFKTAFKPTSSISKPQETIDFFNYKNETINIEGRHDVIIAIKGLHVINAIANYVVLELLKRNAR